MITTVEPTTTRRKRRAAQQPSDEHAPALPTPPKARRRWGVFAGMAALVCFGALGNVWLHQATTNAVQVVAARSTIERGSVISRDDLMTVEISPDPALRDLAASGLAGLVGKRAALDVAAGSLLTSDAVTAANIPPTGQSLVGVGVSASMMPGANLVAGDRVRVVSTPGLQGDSASTPTSIAAVVVGVQADGNTPTGAQTVITVQVPTADAAALAALSSTGKVAVVLDSRDR